MGSAAPKAVDHARALLGELERESRRSIAQSGEINVPALVEILESGLDDMAHRPATVAFLAAFLSRCLTGSVPDYSFWDPPH